MSKSKQYSILVVDDTEANRYAICRTLRAEGFSTMEAATGREALKMVQEEAPDLVILDVHLPDLLGFEVCKVIKSEPKTSHLPVLQVSASYVTTKDRIHGLEGGADTYLTHPIEPGVLIATIRSLQRNRALDEKLRVNEERLRLALRGAEIGTWDIDLETKTCELSERSHAILGIDVSESVSWFTLARRLRPDDRRTTFAELKHMLSGQRGSDFHLEVRLRDRDGSARWISIDGTSVSGADGKGPLRYVGTMRDISESRHAREMIEDAKEAAENANRAKSRFLANISHEIRTPLGVILGFSDLAQEANQSEEDHLNSLSAIKRNALQLSRLIDELLDLSKIEADRLVVENLRFSLYELVDEVISSFSVIARDKGLQLRTELKGPLPAMVFSDPTRVRQVLVNLLGNAIKFTERGYVALQVSTEGILETGRSFRVRFKVQDTGIGIRPDQSEKIFEPFVQADSSTTRRYGGTGLGLMLSRRLAEVLGGDLKLEKSEPGCGATFGLAIPAGEFDGAYLKPYAPNSGASAPSLISDGGLKDLQVLLVEDSADNQVLIRRFLVQAGAEVEVASDGQEGVHKALAGSYDVILMDIQMPVKDGYESMRELRARGYDRPIVALTAHALIGERENCLREGFSDYLTKPINRSLLIDRLGKCRPEESGSFSHA